MIYKAFCTKLKINGHQVTLMAKYAEYDRLVFNWGLSLWIEAYKSGGIYPEKNQYYC